jgi:hypothetical protein
MLRTVVLVIAAIIAASGAALLLAGVTGPGIEALLAGAVVVAGIVFERRYHNNQRPPDAHWQPTGERFSDPTTGKEVEVFYDPQSGERRYVER